jgi:short-subunit dehydrogenase
LKKVAIFGATSAIAQCVARLYAKENAIIYLLGRDNQKLGEIAKDLKIRGAEDSLIKQADFAQVDMLETLAQEVWETMDGVDVVLIAHGTLPEHAAMVSSYENTADAIKVNALSYIAILTKFANLMERQGSGSLAVISSVAGDRGRQSNYVYGTAKAAVNVFTQGLRNRLSSKGINVITIKPGFVDTPMTMGLPKGALWAQPDAVANDIYKGIQKGKNIVYTPFFWRYIMLVITHIPEMIFKRLSL